jgi:hypothetical protein
MSKTDLSVLLNATSSNIQIPVVHVKCAIKIASKTRVALGQDLISATEAAMNVLSL